MPSVNPTRKGQVNKRHKGGGPAPPRRQSHFIGEESRGRGGRQRVHFFFFFFFDFSARPDRLFVSADFQGGFHHHRRTTTTRNDYGSRHRLCCCRARLIRRLGGQGGQGRRQGTIYPQYKRSVGSSCGSNSTAAAAAAAAAPISSRGSCREKTRQRSAAGRCGNGQLVARRTRRLPTSPSLAFFPFSLARLTRFLAARPGPACVCSNKEGKKTSGRRGGGRRRRNVVDGTVTKLGDVGDGLKADATGSPKLDEKREKITTGKCDANGMM